MCKIPGLWIQEIINHMNSGWFERKGFISSPDGNEENVKFGNIQYVSICWQELKASCEPMCARVKHRAVIQT